MVSLQGPGPTEPAPNPSQLSSSLGRGTKALPDHWSPLPPPQGHNFSALPFQSSLSLILMVASSIPQIFLSKTKLEAPPPFGVLSLSPFSMEILELTLFPLCSFLHSSYSSPHMCPTSPSPGWRPLLHLLGNTCLLASTHSAMSPPDATLCNRV